MKISWIVITILIAAVAIVSMAGCGSDEAAIDEGAIVVNTNPQQTGIWVNGEGKVMATPDLAEINLGVESEANTVNEAQSQAAASMDAVISTLQESGIDEKDIQTSRFSIYPVRKWDDNGDEYILVGYRVTNTVYVKIRDLDKVGDIIDSVAIAGGDFTRIEGINFSVEDPTPFKDEARDKAFTQAKDKADQLATLSGLTLGEVTYVTETSYYASTVRMSADSFGGLAPGEVNTPISPGEQEISVSIQVAFDIK
ncbi:SIMPL domain-containing protein [Chloroflexota bacterium]